MNDQEGRFLCDSNVYCKLCFLQGSRMPDRPYTFDDMLFSQYYSVSQPKPTPAAAKPKGFPAQKPSGYPHVTPSSSISSTASSVFSTSSGPGSGSSKSSGSSTSSGSGSGFKPMPAPRRGGGGGQNPSTDTGEEGSTRSVKDLKAMFSKR